ncbi:MAG: hypothetical protein IJ168_08305 [Eubacterium sp.]|nr:hypothetical protein [Eubacterium sp.]
MGMRKYKRAIARKRMEKEGIRRINRKTRLHKNAAPGKSYFAENWREYA